VQELQTLALLTVILGLLSAGINLITAVLNRSRRDSPRSASPPTPQVVISHIIHQDNGHTKSVEESHRPEHER
jgi:hypothetical protein